MNIIAVSILQGEERDARVEVILKLTADPHPYIV
jgi:hypothetical protein